MATIKGRVGKIRHIYRYGSSYREEIDLGGFQNQKQVPETYKEINLDQAIVRKIEGMGYIDKDLSVPKFETAPLPTQDWSVFNFNNTKTSNVNTPFQSTNEALKKIIDFARAFRQNNKLPSQSSTIELPQKTGEELIPAVINYTINNPYGDK